MFFSVSVFGSSLRLKEGVPWWPSSEGFCMVTAVVRVGYLARDRQCTELPHVLNLATITTPTTKTEKIFEILEIEKLKFGFSKS